MTPALILSLVAVCITGAGILVQLGRVLSTVDVVLSAQTVIAAELRALRELVDTLRREAAVRDSTHEHLGDAIGVHAGAIARIEARLDATPHHGPPRSPR